jgi:hypothetical protein
MTAPTVAVTTCAIRSLLNMLASLNPVLAADLVDGYRSLSRGCASF